MKNFILVLVTVIAVTLSGCGRLVLEGIKMAGVMALTAPASREFAIGEFTVMEKESKKDSSGYSKFYFWVYNKSGEEVYKNILYTYHELKKEEEVVALFREGGIDLLPVPAPAANPPPSKVVSEIPTMGFH